MRMLLQQGGGQSWSALRGRQIAYDEYGDNMQPCEYENWQRKVLSECLRILKPTGSLFYNHKDILANGLVVAPKWVYDFPLHQQIIWNRGSSLANDPHYFQPIVEYIYWITKDPKKVKFNKSQSAFRQSVWSINFETNTPHPAPFPEKMVDNIVLCCSQKGDLVYDPFMGSGTTAKMAIRAKRHFVGSEISKEYCKIAEQRIKNEQMITRLF